MNSMVVRWHLGRAFVIVLAVVCAGVYEVESRQLQEINEPVEVSAVDPRPLAAAIREVENRFGWVITYEDPPYEWALDVEDVTLSVSKSPNPASRVLIPRWRSFEFSYPETRDSRPTAVVSAMIRDYNLQAYGDEFRLIGSRSAFHVVPRLSANTRGTPTPRQSRLEVPVRLDDAQRSGLELIEAVLDQVSAATGLRIGPGNVPTNLLVQAKLHLGAKGEPARDVLLRALEATGRKLSWQLFCDPGSTKMCAFNVHVVPDPQ